MSELIGEHFIGREINVYGNPAMGAENFLGGGYLRGVKEGLLLLSEGRDSEIDLVIVLSTVGVIAIHKPEYDDKPDQATSFPRGTARC